MRTTTGLLLASGILAAAALTGCSASGAASSCAPQWPLGGVADAVEVTGAMGGEVSVSFPTPLVQAESSTTAVIEQGDGEIVEEGRTAQATLTIVDGTTGETLTAGTVLSPVDALEPRLTTALECVAVGSRVVAVGPASELIGADYIAENSLGFDPEQTLVYVIDVLGSYLGRANGVDRLPQNGLPTISLAPDGRPGFTFTNSPPPEDLRISVLKEGSGEVLEEGDSVVLNYTGVSWSDREVFDSSWDANAPAVFVAADSTTTEGGLIPGFAQALIGQKVGSQVLVSIPAELAYPEGSGSSLAGQSLLFVFDVLGIQEEG